MKKLILVGCFVLGAVTMSFAQGRQQRSPEEQAKGLQTQLKLTDDQTTKITAIYATQATKRDSLMKAANGDRQAMMSAFRPMQEATNAKIQALLTDEQKDAYKKMMAERMNRGGGGGGQGGGGGTPPPPPAK
jgi:protein CpxP